MSEASHNVWVIELATPNMSVPLQLILEDELVIGRSSPDVEEKPDIDLGPYGADEAGISRRHLALFVEEEQLMVMDLNSQNGTLLFGKRMEPEAAYPIETGCELQLGLLPIELNVLASPSLGSSVHTQPGVQLDDRPVHGTGGSILIVEDDPTIAELLSKVMQKAGYRTAVTHEVVGAIREYNKRRPDTILLDLMLPDMNGLEFCRYVRRDVFENTVPIVVISAHKTTSQIEEAMNAGADVFLRKPFSIKELRKIVTSLIGQTASGTPSDKTKHLVGTAPLQSVPPAARPHSVVLYVAGHSDEPITLDAQDRVSFGRTLDVRDPSSHIDLTDFGAVDFGVSRVHAYLYQEQGRFYVDDANSTNRTYINGDAIMPGEPVRIKNGDEIRLGMLRMYVYFLDESEPQMMQF